jgi:FAD:protein FMN transferase
MFEGAATPRQWMGGREVPGAAKPTRGLPPASRGVVPLVRLGLPVVLFLAGPAAAVETPVLERSVYAMGTQLDLRVEGALPPQLVAATEAAILETERIEAACSTWRKESDWSRFNGARGAVYPLGREWTRLLGTVLDWNRRTDGAFDPVLGRLIGAWGTRTGGRTPTPSELKAAREASGASLLWLGPDDGTAQLRHPGAALEEGGFLKGYALDRMAAELRRAGVSAALLNFGGQLLAFGHPYQVGIAAPQARDSAQLEVRLENASLSSSGTSEHGRHILDPATGERCPAWGSASVVAEDGLTADILSTALFVMGPERGLRWANAHRVAALFQLQEHGRFESDAFRALRANNDAGPVPRGNHP